MKTERLVRDDNRGFLKVSTTKPRVPTNSSSLRERSQEKGFRVRPGKRKLKTPSSQTSATACTRIIRNKGKEADGTHRINVSFLVIDYIDNILQERRREMGGEGRETQGIHW